MEITIDEWLVHYISDPQRCEMAFKFLDKVFRKCDKFVTINDKGLMQKIYQMSRDSANWEPASRRIAKYFFASFMVNSSKFHRLDPSTINQLPDDLRQQIPNDDIYLVETAMNTEAKFILTTDGRLKERLSGWKDLNIQLVDEFLQEYDC